MKPIPITSHLNNKVAALAASFASLPAELKKFLTDFMTLK